MVEEVVQRFNVKAQEPAAIPANTSYHRVMIQAAVHRKSLEGKPDIPLPNNHGLKMAEEYSEVDWMTLPPTAEVILEHKKLCISVIFKKKSVMGRPLPMPRPS